MKIKKDLYTQDFYAWTQQSARLIREGRFGELDLEHIAEEIESMGASERRELIKSNGQMLCTGVGSGGDFLDVFLNSILEHDSLDDLG